MKVSHPHVVASVAVASAAPNSASNCWLSIENYSIAINSLKALTAEQENPPPLTTPSKNLHTELL